MIRRMREDALCTRNPHLALFRRGTRRSGVDSLGLRLENLAAPIHAALEVDVVRTAQFARILVFDVRGRLERVGRAAHAAARGGSFASGNGHRRNSNSEAGGEARNEKARLLHAIGPKRQAFLKPKSKNRFAAHIEAGLGPPHRTIEGRGFGVFARCQERLPVSGLPEPFNHFV
jgi:hypothetical protein